jgi:hypothetical protein
VRVFVSAKNGREKCRKNITLWKLQGIWGMLGQEIGRRKVLGMWWEKGFARIVDGGLVQNEV